MSIWTYKVEVPCAGDVNHDRLQRPVALVAHLHYKSVLEIRLPYKTANLRLWVVKVNNELTILQGHVNHYGLQRPVALVAYLQPHFSNKFI